MRKTWLYAVLAAGLMTGCDDEATEPGPPEIVPTEDLVFLRFSETLSLPVRDTTFVAYYGEDAELRLFTDPEPGEDSGDEFFRFTLDDE